MAKGPRPFTIQLACLLLVGTGAWNLWIGLRDLRTAQATYTERFDWFAWDRDWTIVALSAEFTIALIPAVLVFVFARGIARWIIAVFFGARIVMHLREVYEYWDRVEVVLTPLLIEAAIYAVTIALLLTPSAGRWFAGRQEGDFATFS